MSESPIIGGIEDVEDGVCVQIVGDIDLSCSPDLRVELLQVAAKKPARLLLDLTGVEYMDSSGVATLVEALQVQKKASAALILFGLQPKVRSIFEIARLDMVFKIVADRQEADGA